MMRPLWTGSIAFGLVNIPVRLFTAVKDKSVRLHMMSPNGSCRLHQKLYCPDTGKEYNFSETTRAYDLGAGDHVLIKPEELEKLNPEKGDSIDILDFTKEQEVDPIFHEKTYYLCPDRRAGKAYTLLFEVMRNTDMVAIGRFIMRSKEYLCLLRPYRDVICLHTLNYFDEVMLPNEIPNLQKELKGVRVTAKELEMGKRLVERMITKFDPTQYEDEYRKSVKKLIQAKARGAKPVIRQPTPQKAKVIDLMDALQKSITRKKPSAESHHRRAS